MAPQRIPSRWWITKWLGNGVYRFIKTPFGRKGLALLVRDSLRSYVLGCRLEGIPLLYVTLES